MKKSVTFDSNVFQILCGHQSYGCSNHVELIKKKIYNKEIIPYISESILTYEMITKQNRKKFISEYTGNIEISENNFEGKKHLSTKIGPNANAHTGIPDAGRYRIHWIKEFDITLLKIYRTAIFEIEELKTFKSFPFSKTIHDKYCKTHYEFEELGFGMQIIEDIGYSFDSQNWQNGIEIAPENQNKKITSAIGEWSDRDSVLTHYAHDIDIFCTNDNGINAGTNSIFSINNKQLLKERFNIHFRSLEELYILFTTEGI